MNKKKNIPFIIALSIPVLMVVLTSISIYLPRMFVKPRIDFIYSTGQNYCHNNWYSVQNQKIVKHDPEKIKENHSCQNYQEPRLFYYDVKEDTSREISMNEAEKFVLDNRFKSADGFEIVSGGRGFDGLFFSGSSYYDKFLKKGAYSRKLKKSHTQYYYNFKFLGWVKEDNHG